MSKPSRSSRRGKRDVVPEGYEPRVGKLLQLRGGRTSTVAGGSRAAIRRGATRDWSASVVVVARWGTSAEASVAPPVASLRDRLQLIVLAATNKYLAQGNKSLGLGKTTKRR
jgi:hypothetical protein